MKEAFVFYTSHVRYTRILYAQTEATPGIVADQVTLRLGQLPLVRCASPLGEARGPEGQRTKQ